VRDLTISTLFKTQQIAGKIKAICRRIQVGENSSFSFFVLDSFQIAEQRRGLKGKLGSIFI
jgi:hypothetical protein